MWSNSSFALQGLRITNQTASSINQIHESFVVEDVWFKTVSGTKYADVTIRNTGNLAIRVSNIYVNNTKVPITPQTIAIGNVGTIQNIPVNWGSGDIQQVTVQTDRGTIIKQNWKS
jgi:hypothetical protein